MDRVQRRLTLALGASALLHVWMVQTGEGSGARRVTASAAASLTATIHATDNPTGRVALDTDVNTALNATQSAPSIAGTASQKKASVPTLPEPRHSPVAEPGRAAALAFNAGVASAAAAVSGNPVVAPQGGASREGAAVLPQPGDATYYTARSLDIFPRALTALELGPQPGAGKARATVLIDESGTVNEVRAIEAGAADIASAMRDLLLRTRFTPASKDGRLVKAQLLVSVDYGTDDRQ